MTEVGHLVPLDGLARFLDDRFGPSEASVEVSRLGEGHSNLTFLVRRGEEEWVLRRPPRGDILPGTHEMHREYAVMKAIGDEPQRSGAEPPRAVPVPRVHELCPDDSYIGAPFYLMDRVDGIVVRGAAPAPFDDADGRRALGLELLDRLADIHTLDWEAIGLGPLARDPGRFLERNLGRMQELYDAVRHREVPEVDEAGEWLRTNAPAQAGVTLTHGDYKLDNVMFAPDLPARIAAVVDWEVAAIGDPLVDLGWLLYFSPDADDPVAAALTGGGDAGGYPSRGELAERYAERTGRASEHMRFYAALAGWKIAIIMEGSNYRHKQGMADDSMFSALDAVVPALAGRSLQIIRGEIPVGM